jgi:Na+/H+-dicarboxylate symporter
VVDTARIASGSGRAELEPVPGILAVCYRLMAKVTQGTLVEAATAVSILVICLILFYFVLYLKLLKKVNEQWCWSQE